MGRAATPTTAVGGRGRSHLTPVSKPLQRRSKKFCSPALFILRGGKVNRKRAATSEHGPFVYRLGRQVFNLERGVRFPYGLPFFFGGGIPNDSEITARLPRNTHATLTLGIEPVLREALKNAALGERCSLANMDEVMIQDYSKNHGHALPDAAEELKPGNRSE